MTPRTPTIPVRLEEYNNLYPSSFLSMVFKPQAVITSILHPLGFRRDGNYWIKETDTHFYYLVLYASSQGGSDKYIDIRAFFKELAKPGETFKKRRHVSYRLQETGPLDGALNYNHEFKDLTDEERTARLTKGIIEHGLPVLKSFETVEGLKKLWLENHSTLMNPELRTLIGLPYSRPK